MIPKSLKYVCDEDSGIYRKIRGRGFEYVTRQNEKVDDELTMQRINNLVIPPNWKDVWICQDPEGHLQATGYDEKGRKQYLYHQSYKDFQQKSKYKELYHFGKALPVIRARVQRDLKKEGWPKEKVLALIVKVLDEYHFRIGSQQYAEENESYGITTLRRKHVKNEKGELILEFKGKSGVYQKVHVSNPRLQKMIRETSELPGYELFRYLDENKKSKNIHSQDVNEYIQQITEEEFTAKDFRTWGGTVSAVEVSKEARKIISGNPRKKLDTTIIKKVAERLGNTVATCREYYVHPKVLKTILNKDPEEISEDIPEDVKYPHLLRKTERKVLNIIK